MTRPTDTFVKVRGERRSGFALVLVTADCTQHHLCRATARSRASGGAGHPHSAYRQTKVQAPSHNDHGHMGSWSSGRACIAGWTPLRPPIAVYQATTGAAHYYPTASQRRPDLEPRLSPKDSHAAPRETSIAPPNVHTRHPISTFLPPAPQRAPPVQEGDGYTMGRMSTGVWA